MLNHGVQLSWDDVLEQENMIQAFLMQSEDFEEGIKPFMKNVLLNLSEQKRFGLNKKKGKSKWMIIFSGTFDVLRIACEKCSEEAYPFSMMIEPPEITRIFGLNLEKMGFFSCPWGIKKIGGIDFDFSYSMILMEELERVGQGIGSGVSLHSEIVAPYIAALETDSRNRNGFLTVSAARKLLPLL